MRILEKIIGNAGSRKVIREQFLKSLNEPPRALTDENKDCGGTLGIRSENFERLLELIRQQNQSSNETSAWEEINECVSHYTMHPTFKEGFQIENWKAVIIRGAGWFDPVVWLFLVAASGDLNKLVKCQREKCGKWMFKRTPKTTYCSTACRIDAWQKTEAGRAAARAYQKRHFIKVKKQREQQERALHRAEERERKRKRSVKWPM